MLFKFNFSKAAPFADALLLLLLAAYTLAGVPLATYHGDEGMQIYASRDFDIAFVDGDPWALTTTPPYPIDSPQYLRIINGSIHRYAVGAVLQWGGFGGAGMPIEPGWNWGLSYEENVAGGWLPSEPILHAARYASAVLFALSLLPVFGIGWVLGGRVAAYVGVLLYGFNPLLLINARRSMMEGSLLFFGMLALWAAVLIADRLVREQRVSVGLWVGLAVAGALTLASKHSGAIFLVGAWGWVAWVALWMRRAVWQRWGGLLLAGIAAIALFVGMSPALWSNPIDRFQDLARLRAELIEIQVSLEADAPMTTGQRVVWAVTQPYITPPKHYDRPDWGNAADIRASEQAYNASGLSGMPSHPALGALIMLAAAAGAVALVRGWPPMGIGLVWWVGVTTLALLLNPLPWDRYYIPLVPPLAFLAAVGTAALVRWICEQTRTERALQSTGT